MRIDTEFGKVELVDEPMYTFGSMDNARTYQFSKNLAAEGLPTSIHGVLLNNEPIAVFGESGGCSAIHSHSAIFVNGHIFLAVGNSVACMRLSPFEFKWAKQVDSATCFGIYYQPQHQALISHGELEITRLSRDGDIQWSASGADIFSEGVSLLADFLEATDFNGNVYHFDYEHGRSSP